MYVTNRGWVWRAGGGIDVLPLPPVGNEGDEGCCEGEGVWINMMDMCVISLKPLPPPRPLALGSYQNTAYGWVNETGRCYSVLKKLSGLLWGNYINCQQSYSNDNNGSLLLYTIEKTPYFDKKRWYIVLRYINYFYWVIKPRVNVARSSKNCLSHECMTYMISPIRDNTWHLILIQKRNLIHISAFSIGQSLSNRKSLRYYI